MSFEERCHQFLNDPSVHWYAKMVLMYGLKLDPVDAVNDVATVKRLLEERLLLVEKMVINQLRGSL